MQWAGKAMDVLTRSSNNNIVINTFLVGVFAALCFRSANQQNEIQALEAEKTLLLKPTKPPRNPCGIGNNSFC
ncbi:hypothetical protein IFM89_009777 [Coptis chinensis]|uniref:Uncharacterized protein n=1 Tax=Coptis chinensis TaxID=261450 RepID=A0A835M2K7_9MAGN|nr:hypothetical protein IFM89_009777 [Coptis chinensis]